MVHSEEEQGREHHAFHHEASGAAGQLEERDQAQAQQEVVGWHEPTIHEGSYAQGRWEEAGLRKEEQGLLHEA